MGPKYSTFAILATFSMEGSTGYVALMDNGVEKHPLANVRQTSSMSKHVHVHILLGDREVCQHSYIIATCFVVSHQNYHT